MLRSDSVVPYYTEGTRLGKIISGGQTGVDRGALEAAYSFGIRTGGYAPRSFMTELGPDYTLSSKFRLIEETTSRTPVEAYKIRTVMNIRKADITLILSEVNHDQVRSGTTYTWRQAIYNRRLVWNYVDLESPRIVKILADRLQHHALYEINNMYGSLHAEKVKIRGLRINVAGQRESKNPGLQERVHAFLFSVFTQMSPESIRMKHRR